ncbi:hypothetical protein LINGRAHAP2_LOCUS2245 [Linum grandiflorum]
MDWFSWLSKSTLDPSLVCEYSLTFQHNELQFDDLTYFNHEFLQSMGISVAKHRLEILKLASKETTFPTKPRSGIHGLVKAISRTIKHRIAKFVSSGEGGGGCRRPPPLPELEWKPATTTTTAPLLPVLKRRQAKSGPLDFKRVQQENLVFSKSKSSLKLSGPLDLKAHERLVFSYKSPKTCESSPDRPPLVGRVSPRVGVARPIDMRRTSPMVRSGSVTPRGDFDEHSPWTSLFQDMKPT